MLPNYKSFKADLSLYRHNIDTLKTGLLAAVKAEGLNDEEKTTYEWITAKLNNILVAADQLLEEKAVRDPAADSANWDILLGIANDVCPPAFKGDPNRKDEENAADISRKLSSGRMSAMFLVSRRLGEYRTSLSAMCARSEYSEYKTGLIQLAKERTAYYEELDSFELGEEFNVPYEEMLSMHKTYKERFDTAQSVYDTYRINFDNATKAYFAAITEEGSEISRKESRINEIQEEIDEINRRITEGRERIAYLEGAKEFDSANASRIKEVISIHEHESESIKEQIAKSSLDISDTALRRDDAERKYHRLRATMQRTENPQSVPNAPKDTPEAAVRAVAGDYVHLLHVEMDLKDYLKRFNEYIKSAGIDPDDRYAVMDTFRLGETFDKMLAAEKKNGAKNGVITGALFVDKIPQYTRPYEFYMTFRKFVDELKDVYGASEGMRRNMDENVKNPFDLIHLTEKAIDDCRNKTDKMYLGQVEDPRLQAYGLSMSDMRNRLDNVIVTFNEYKESRAEYENLTATLEAIREERARLEQEDEKHKALAAEAREDLRSEKGEFEIARITEEIPKLIEKAQKKGLEITEIRSEILPLQKKIDDCSAVRANLGIKIDESDKELSRAKRAFESIDEKIQRFKKVRGIHDTLAKTASGLDSRLQITTFDEIEADMWRQRRGEMFDQARELVRTADFGKRAGHTNTEEFNAMVNAVKALYTYHEDQGQFALMEQPDRPELQTSEQLKEKFDAIRAAAEHYIEMKSKTMASLGRHQHKIRMDYARGLLRFADNGNNLIKDMDEMKQKLEKDVQAVEFSSVDKSNDSETVRSDVNRTIREKRLGIDPRRPDLNGFLAEKQKLTDELLDKGFVIVESPAVEEMQGDAPENPGI